MYEFFYRSDSFYMMLGVIVLVSLGALAYSYIVVNRDIDRVLERFKQTPKKCPSCGSSQFKTIGSVTASYMWRIFLQTNRRRTRLYGLKCSECGYVSLFTPVDPE
jgi:translation initiation factor 2 beta subunit (eIF-2beta)/eIF-5